MKLYNAMEESYLKENLIHKWVTNIVRQNDGYEFLLDDEVYLPVYKYALKITKRKTVKLNLVEEKVLQIVSIGVHQVDEIAKILGITRPLLDVTLADLHVKDLISVSSDICSLLKKGEQALSNLERVEKQQDIMKDIYMDSFKGKILENITRYQVVEKGIIDDNKLEPLVQAEDMKVIVSRFEDIQEIFQDEYSATRIADGIRTEMQTRVINVPDDRKEFWKENIGILRNPVIRKFVLREDIKLEKKAGISALCEYSLLSDNAYPTYAVTKKKLKASGVKMEKQASVSEDIGCVVLELGYFIDFFGKGLQDPLSVALSLTREEQEERVKISVNEMLEEYVWSKD